MFKAEIKAEILKSVVYNASTITDEVKLVVTSKGISIRAVDIGHIAMVDIDISSAAFTVFEADDCQIGFDLEKLKTVLKLADAMDSVFMEHNPDQGSMTVRIGNITRRMGLIDTTSMNDVKIPPLDIKNFIKVPSEVVKKGIKASESISESITVSADESGFELTCQGDTDSATLRVAASDAQEIGVSGKIRSSYALEYFSNIVKVIPDRTLMELRFENDYPIKILFSLAEGSISVIYFLAPCVNNG